MTEADGTMRDSVVIELIRDAATEGGPPLRNSPEQILEAGRRARRRRRVVTVAASGIALASVTALSFVVGQAGLGGRQIVLTPASSSTGTEEPPDAAQQSEANRQVLRKALGDDFVINESGEFPQGDVTVRLGSPTAESLPAGYAVGASVSAGMVASPGLSELCAPMEEKGLIVDACTTRTLPEGQVVHEQRVHSLPGAYGDAELVAYDGVRVFFLRPDGNLVIVDLWAWEIESSSTPLRRPQAQAWLEAISPRLSEAAIDPSVQAINRSKPSATS